jgi:thiamine biosynthesis lipoprotein
MRLSIQLPGRPGASRIDPMAPPAEDEVVQRFACFGGACAVLVTGPGPAGTAREAAEKAKRSLLIWHEQFSRFAPDSELSRLNRDPQATVSVSPVMARFVQSALQAAEMTGGLVDPTLAAEIEAAGYGEHFESASLPLARALALAPPRAPGGPSPTAAWRRIEVDRPGGTVTRPPGVRLDTGGIVKGLFGDLLAAVLGGHQSFAVDAAGDVRFGGAGSLRRPVQVASPFTESILHVFELVSGAAATSGIGKRSWLGADGRPAHHLLDPATGRPAFTGIVQVTALAPTAVQAEALSKQALLSGPDRAGGCLAHGGVIVYDDASLDVLEPSAALTEPIVAAAAS